ncbi:cora-domain-containing protein [Saitoella complicata NRRL Y-17804]|uniref:cora-domain-containing protein n=1 Tax=Saitoella complicata (strain BCRC 22490 / CBS 7301 / JCM 7358 / NBRC 10748 / NRRL Y-17804) TaxID=698492 RepID=UPI00086732FF|nr:cora-domain-containing protein [Saitoella complicata NRRL Y-17804]ODQ51915.1 cora-domain-containing protein [Saitoella complicata NRRL Y-17804]
MSDTDSPVDMSPGSPVGRQSEELLDHRNQPHNLPRGRSNSLVPPSPAVHPISSPRVLAQRVGTDNVDVDVDEARLDAESAMAYARRSNKSDDTAVERIIVEEALSPPPSSRDGPQSAARPRRETNDRFMEVRPSPMREISDPNNGGTATRSRIIDFQDVRPQRRRSSSSSGSTTSRRSWNNRNDLVRTPSGNRRTRAGTIDPFPLVKDDDAVSRVDSNHTAQPAEEDVCFPMSDEPSAPGIIDFDEIEEFVEEERARRGSFMSEEGGSAGSSQGHSRKYSSSSAFRARMYPYGAGGYAGYGGDGRDGSAIADEDDIDLEKQTIAIDHAMTKASAALPELRKTNTVETTMGGISGLDEGEREKEKPERFSFFNSEMDETIHAVTMGDLTQEGQSFRDLFSAQNGTWWLDCLNPSDAEMRMLAKAFGIHPLTAEDIRTQETREKVELFKSYYFVCFRSFEADPSNEEYLEPVNHYLVVFRDGILSFHFSPSPHPANVRRRIRQLRDYISVSSDWIGYALIDDITDSFAPLVARIERETELIEDAVLTARAEDHNEMLRRMGECRRVVMGLIRLLGGKADVIKMFAKRCNEHWDVAPKSEIGLYLGDIQDHLITMFSSLSQFEKILSRSHSNYLAQLSVDSIMSNNRVNVVLSRITVIGTILVPMNIITGLFGMNVHVPGMEQPTFAWFGGICAFMVLIISAGMYFARRARVI